MSNELKVVGGINLVPEANFPFNPSEGTLFSSDGSINPPGIYQYLSGVWVSLTGAPAIEPREARQIPILNPDAEIDISGWSFVDANVTSNTSGSITRNTTNPLSKTSDFQVVTSSVTDGTYVLLPDYADHVRSESFDLSYPIEKGNEIQINLDIVFATTAVSQGYTGSFNTPKEIIIIGVYNSSNVLIDQEEVTFGVSSIVAGDPYTVSAKLDISAEADTNLHFRMHTYVLDIDVETVGAGFLSNTYNFNNVEVSIVPKNKLGTGA